MAQAPQPFAREANLPTGKISIVPLGTFDIPADTDVTGNFTPLNVLVQPGILNQVGDVQSVWIDATTATDPVIIRNVQTRQYMRWPPGSFGWQNLLVKADALQMEMYCFAASTISMCVADGLLASYVSDGGLNKSAIYATVTEVAASASAVNLLTANPQRSRFSLENNSTAFADILCAPTGTVTPTHRTKRLVPGEYWECPAAYGGRVSAIWTAANGRMQITEYL